MIRNKISGTSKLMLWVAAVLLVISLLVPIWQIDLDAPQYPEGLRLLIWANKIAGDVEIINGLNHYIGMKTLHSEDFIEFRLLPYLIVLFALLFGFTAVKASKKWLNISLAAFIVFGIVAMVDFWKWEYDYGHNLDPNAAIKVPGMSYQPPLIGFKQLLNFGAYSVPAAGGWLLVAAGILVLVSVLKENKFLGKKRDLKKNALAKTVCLVLLFSSCGDAGPQAINLNSDGCDFCRMTISDGKSAAELITQKGRVYKFDDIGCMLRYIQEQKNTDVRTSYVSDYSGSNELIDVKAAWYVRHDEFKTPMGGNVAAFASRDAAIAYAAKLNAVVKNWEELDKTQLHHDNVERDEPHR